MKFYPQALTFLLKPQIWSFHSVVLLKTAKKWSKVKNARAGLECAKLLLLLAKYAHVCDVLVAVGVVVAIKFTKNSNSLCVFKTKIHRITFQDRSDQVNCMRLVPRGKPKQLFCRCSLTEIRNDLETSKVGFEIFDLWSEKLKQPCICINSIVMFGFVTLRNSFITRPCFCKNLVTFKFMPTRQARSIQWSTREIITNIGFTQNWRLLGRPKRRSDKLETWLP